MFDDCNAVERWRISTCETGPRFITTHPSAFCFLIRPLVFHATRIFLTRPGWTREGLFFLGHTMTVPECSAFLPV